MANISPFELGFLAGLVAFAGSACWLVMNRHIVRSTLAAAPVTASEISHLRLADCPVPLLMDAHIEVVKCGYAGDIAALARLYREIEGSRPNSHALRREYVARLDRAKPEEGSS
jgi:hypothetical protein